LYHPPETIAVLGRHENCEAPEGTVVEADVSEQLCEYPELCILMELMLVDCPVVLFTLNEKLSLDEDADACVKKTDLTLEEPPKPEFIAVKRKTRATIKIPTAKIVMIPLIGILSRILRLDNYSRSYFLSLSNQSFPI
jgi:hypothetical protein